MLNSGFIEVATAQLQCQNSIFKKNMAKNYTDALTEWAKNQGKTSKARRDRHWVVFLAVKADVEAAIEAGYALRTIWEHMRETGRITYRYETFLKHVSRLKKIKRMSLLQNDQQFHLRQKNKVTY